MTPRRLALAAAGIAGVALVAWGIFVALPRVYGPASAPGGPAAAPGEESERRIRVTVFYGSGDGMHLVGVDREVPFESNPSEQAHRIIEAQLQPPPDGLVSVMPAGTRVRAVFVTDRNEAFVDLSGEASRAHPGGSLSELYTVYSVVNAVTVNLPAVTAVQILVDGREVDTLAGHVDLRQPLERSARWSEPANQQ